MLIFISYGVIFGMIGYMEIAIIWQNKCQKKIDPDARNITHDVKALGAIMMLWAIHNLFYAILSIKKAVSIIMLFGLNMVALVVHSCGVWKNFDEKTELAAGIIGCGAAAVAYYIGFGLMLNYTFPRTIFPQGTSISNFNFMEDDDKDD